MDFNARQSVVMGGGGDYSKTVIPEPERDERIYCKDCGLTEVKHEDDSCGECQNRNQNLPHKP